MWYFFTAHNQRRQRCYIKCTNKNICAYTEFYERVLSFILLAHKHSCIKSSSGPKMAILINAKRKLSSVQNTKFRYRRSIALFLRRSQCILINHFLCKHWGGREGGTDGARCEFRCRSVFSATIIRRTGDRATDISSRSSAGRVVSSRPPPTIAGDAVEFLMSYYIVSPLYAVASVRVTTRETDNLFFFTFFSFLIILGICQRSALIPNGCCTMQHYLYTHCIICKVSYNCELFK